MDGAEKGGPGLAGLGSGEAAALGSARAEPGEAVGAAVAVGPVPETPVPFSDPLSCLGPVKNTTNLF